MLVMMKNPSKDEEEEDGPPKKEKDPYSMSQETSDEEDSWQVRSLSFLTKYLDPLY